MSLFSVRDLHVHYGAARAVDGVSFEWREGEVLGIVGESGCGKSTLARAMLGLVPTAGGEIEVDGAPVRGRAELRALRRRVQMVFQDPYQTLNPRMRVRAIVTEPLVVQKRAGGRARGAGRPGAGRRRPARRSGSPTATRTSCPAASASASRSPPRSCSIPTG